MRTILCAKSCLLDPIFYKYFSNVLKFCLMCLQTTTPMILLEVFVKSIHYNRALHKDDYQRIGLLENCV